MADEAPANPWTMLFETGGKFLINGARLKGMVHDIPSWLAFIRMIAVGTPAPMKIIRNDGRVELCKVIPTRLATAKSSYANPLPDLDPSE